MRFLKFIRDNRKEIDETIKRILKDPSYQLNDNERKQWVENDESLYNWARSEGVNI